MREIKKIQRNQQTTRKISSLAVQAKSTNHADMQADPIQLSWDSNKDAGPTCSRENTQDDCDTNMDHSKTGTNYTFQSAPTIDPNDYSPASNSDDSIDDSNLQNQRTTYASVASSKRVESAQNYYKKENINRVHKKQENPRSKSTFTGYTFVRGKRKSRRIVLANIKARGTSYEEVKDDIKEWCDHRDVNIHGIYLLAHHSKRKFPTFVIRANIDEDDYDKTQESDFWPETISVRDWIARQENNDHADMGRSED